MNLCMVLGSNFYPSSPQKLPQNRFFVFLNKEFFFSLQQSLKMSKKIQFLRIFSTKILKLFRRRKIYFAAIFGGWRDLSLSLGPSSGSKSLPQPFQNCWRLIFSTFLLTFEGKKVFSRSGRESLHRSALENENFNQKLLKMQVGCSLSIVLPQKMAAKSFFCHSKPLLRKKNAENYF